MSAFRGFTLEFFGTLGQAVAEVGDRLHVSLTGELAAYYGRDALVLTFKPHDPEGELVAYGSRAFETMIDFLATRGRHSRVRLAERDDPGVQVRLVNGHAEAEAEWADPRTGYALNYHLTCLSDERTERLVTFCLDPAGRPLPELEGWLTAAAGAASEVTPGPLPAEVVRAAEDMAMAEAEQLAEALEEETLGRLRKAATRLVSYYEEQIAEIPIRRRKGQTEEEAVEAALAERAHLKQELGRKLGEETARHQLRLQVRRISQAVVEVPGRARTLRLVAGQAERRVTVWENRHTGACEAPGCERCGTMPLAPERPELAYGLCVEQHVVCPGCLGACAACRTDHCHAELAECHHCGGGACTRCRSDCAGGHVVCHIHLGSCGCCGQAFCEGCLSACPDCADGVRLARAHGHPCRVCDRPVCESHARGCGLCGQAVCGGDRTACPGCGDEVCHDHMGLCAHCELPYCGRCRDGGSACRACGAVGQSVPAPASWLEPLAGVAAAARYGHWLGIENERYRYVLGRGLLGDLLVVLDGDGALVRLKEIGFWRKLFGWMG